MRDAVLKKTIDAQLWMEGALVSPETEEGSTTVEYAIGAIATVQ